MEAISSFSPLGIIGILGFGNSVQLFIEGQQNSYLVTFMSPDVPFLPQNGHSFPVTLGAAQFSRSSPMLVAIFLIQGTW